MVRADVKHDYYADLECPATADLEEIKKQFRLLAKQYHPDRNPGHEVEMVPKFQAVQAAHEVLSDPNEKAKYDAGRAKLAARTNNTNPPPPKDADPYNFRRPAQPKPANAVPPSFPFPPPPPPQQGKPNPKTTYNRRAQTSAGAEMFNAYTRGAPQSWDRSRYEEAARAEAAQRFQNLRSAGTSQQAPPPPRPPRPHPTAPKTTSAAASPDLPNAPNGIPPGFPGLSRTASGRKLYHGQTDDSSQRTSAYAYMRGDRPPPTTTQGYVPEAYSTHSPPLTKSRPQVNPLRHTRSSDQGVRGERPAYERSSSRYAGNSGERTNINGPALGRSASVRNSPVDKKYEDAGAFGRPHSHYGHPPARHHSASPKIRPAEGVSVDFSSSSGSSDEEPLSMNNHRPKATPRPARGRTATNDGLEGQFPNTNYTRVLDENPNQYHYPPPEPKHPTRNPFPDMTSPNDQVPPSGGFRYAQFRRVSGKGPYLNGLPSWVVPSSVSISQANFYSNPEPKATSPENVFQPAKFSTEDWAERLKSTSPMKRGSKSRETPMSRSNHSPDAMDLDPADEKPPHSNGVDLNDLAKEVPFAPAGLADFGDVATNLPFESKASGRVNLDRPPAARLRNSDLPRPPKPVIPPSEDRLTRENWEQYVRTMNAYMREWLLFNGKMIAHFKSRHEQVSKGMKDNWIGMGSDGPSADQVDINGVRAPNGVPKAGYAAYMVWLNEDAMCHAWWDRANEIHRSCLEDLGKLREKMKTEGAVA